MSPARFRVDPTADEGFYVIVGTDLTVYESYVDAIDEIENKIAAETSSFLAEVTIDNNGNDDLEFSLEQVGWQQIIRDITSTDTEEDSTT